MFFFFMHSMPYQNKYEWKMSKNPCLLFSLVFLSVAQRVMRVNKYIRQSLTFFLFGPRIGVQSFAITLIFFVL